MRYSIVWAGLGAVLVMISGSLAGPLERDATSKLRGDVEGRRQVRRAYYPSYRYGGSTPQVVTVENAAPARQVTPKASANEAQAEKTRTPQAPGVKAPARAPLAQSEKDAQAAAVDSRRTADYSYESAPSMSTVRTYRRGFASPRYLHADRKALGEY